MHGARGADGTRFCGEHQDGVQRQAERFGRRMQRRAIAALGDRSAMG